MIKNLTLSSSSLDILFTSLHNSGLMLTAQKLWCYSPPFNSFILETQVFGNKEISINTDVSSRFDLSDPSQRLQKICHKHLNKTIQTLRQETWELKTQLKKEMWMCRCSQAVTVNLLYFHEQNDEDCIRPEGSGQLTLKARRLKQQTKT